MSEHAIELGDVVEVLHGYPDCSFDAALFDPPYGLGTRQPTAEELIAFVNGATLDTGGDFMGKDWHVPSVRFWRELLRVLKPGAPVIAFGGTRTVWLINLGLCVAGFETRDLLAWMYGSGFPKSLDVSKAIDAAAGAVRAVVGSKVYGDGHVQNSSESIGFGGCDPAADTRKVTAPATEAARQWHGYGTALKPAFEPAVLARKPLEGTVAANVAKWGVGALAIDASRIEGPPRNPGFVNPTQRDGDWGMQRTGMVGSETPAGRWPANVLLDEEAGSLLDAQTGDRPSTPYRANTATGAVLPMTERTAGGYSDNGGASRFFYCAKAGRKERDLGCDSLPLKSAAEMTDSEEGQARLDSPRTGAGRTGGARNHHPTVKPIALMTYLARLLLPPNPGAILVPFSGSGSEMIGCLKAGWPAVLGIERESEYVEIARARIKGAA